MKQYLLARRGVDYDDENYFFETGCVNEGLFVKLESALLAKNKKEVESFGTYAAEAYEGRLFEDFGLTENLEDAETEVKDILLKHLGETKRKKQFGSGLQEANWSGLSPACILEIMKVTGLAFYEIQTVEAK